MANKNDRQPGLRSYHFIAIAALAGLTFWLLDATFNYYYFREHLRFMLFQQPTSLLDTLVLNTTTYALLVRLSFLGLCLVGGLLAALYAHQRQETEAALRAERDYSTGIIQGTPIIIFGATPDGRITFINSAAEAALGCPAEEIVGRSWWSVFSGEAHEQTGANHFQVLAGGTAREYETVVRAPDGRERVISWSAIGRTLHSYTSEVIGFGRDITESKRAELRLRHRLAVEETVAQASRQFVSAGEVQFRQILRLLGDTMQANRAYIFQVNADHTIVNAFVWTDTRDETEIRRLHGLSRQGLPDLIPILDRKEEIAIENTASLPPREGRGRELVESHHVKALLIVPIRSINGRFMGFLGIDNTGQPRTWPEEDRLALRVVASMIATYWERVAAEQRLRDERATLADRVAERTAALSAANLELARAARLKDEFLAAMSHELRTPLNAILGLAEALQEEIYGKTNDRQRKALHTIERSGYHLLELINDVLDVAKIGAGRMELEMRPVHVPTICESSLRLVRRDALKKQLKVRLEIDEDVTHLQADERRLKQILVNLLSNAVKFTPDGGQIALEVHGDADRQQVEFVVWDTGIGIGGEDLQRLFEPFVQLDSRLSRQYPGTGLGLALVHQMAHLHGGSVSVESELGRGSRFVVCLPWETVTV